jgi:hypothetical protein
MRYVLRTYAGARRDVRCRVAQCYMYSVYGSIYRCLRCQAPLGACWVVNGAARKVGHDNERGMERQQRQNEGAHHHSLARANTLRCPTFLAMAHLLVQVRDVADGDE